MNLGIYKQIKADLVCLLLECGLSRQCLIKKANALWGITCWLIGWLSWPTSTRSISGTSYDQMIGAHPQLKPEPRSRHYNTHTCDVPV